VKCGDLNSVGPIDEVDVAVSSWVDDHALRYGHLSSKEEVAVEVTPCDLARVGVERRHGYVDWVVDCLEASCAASLATHLSNSSGLVHPASDNVWCSVLHEEGDIRL